jgi:hypothetical protein
MSDDELARWSRAWQVLGHDSADWLARARTAHRQEAALHAAYWGMLAAAGVAMAISVACFGVVSWLKLAVGGGLLALGAATMLREGAKVRREHAQPMAAPAAVVSDLVRLLERELEAWTSRGSRWLTAFAASIAAVLCARDWWLAAAAHESAVRPIGGLCILIASLVGLSLVGVRRAANLREELSRLKQLREQLEQ